MTYTPIVTGTGLTGWAFLQRTRDQQQAAFEASARIARDRDSFAEKLPSVQTAADLVDNRDLLRVALGAFGLDEDINNRAFLIKVLDSDLTDDKSLANRLADKRYLALAKTFNFAGKGGPSIDAPPPEAQISDRLAAVRTADDLLSDAGLLRAALRTFGLQTDRSNTFFLQKVLTSDLSDPGSFANRLSDTRYADMARAFDFRAKAQGTAGVAGFAEAFSGALAALETADDLLDRPDLLSAALKVFGLDRDYANIEKPGFLRAVLVSDPYDDQSFAFQQSDKRYRALAKAFAFGDPDTATEDSQAGKLIAKLGARDTPVKTVDDLFNDVGLTLATMAFHDLPQGVGKIDYARRYVEGDPANPASLRSLVTDMRYAAFAAAFPFEPATSGRSYPPGFAAAITQNYIDRQFEAGIGETDPDMRIALSLERDLEQLVSRGGSADTQWFGVMASKPLRSVFETAFRLPSSFGSLDVDEQLKIFKNRSDQFFGTRSVADFTDPDRLYALRRSFLVASSQPDPGTTGSASIVLSLINTASAFRRG